MTAMKIWSLRFSFARGDHWRLERECAEDTTQQWLDIFRADEPGVCFVARTRKPATT